MTAAALRVLIRISRDPGWLEVPDEITSSQFHSLIVKCITSFLGDLIFILLIHLLLFTPFDQGISRDLEIGFWNPLKIERKNRIQVVQ